MIWFIILVETTIKTIWLFGVPCAQLVSGDRITPHLWTNRKVACKGSHKKPRSWGTKKRSPWLFSPLSYPPWKLTNVPWPWMFWKMIHFFFEIWMLPKIVVPPNHPFNRAGFSIINHPFWGTPIFGNTHMLRIFSVFFFTTSPSPWGWGQSSKFRVSTGPTRSSPDPTHPTFATLAEEAGRNVPFWIFSRTLTSTSYLGICLVGGFVCRVFFRDPWVEPRSRRDCFQRVGKVGEGEASETVALDDPWLKQLMLKGCFFSQLSWGVRWDGFANWCLSSVSVS